MSLAGNPPPSAPIRSGTKAAAHYKLSVPAQGSIQIRLRLSADELPAPFSGFDETLARRREEANEYLRPSAEGIADPDARLVQRQALAGMIWSKQFYYFDIPEWLNGDPAQPPPPAERKHGRNSDVGASQQRRHPLDAG